MADDKKPADDGAADEQPFGMGDDADADDDKSDKDKVEDKADEKAKDENCEFC